VPELTEDMVFFPDPGEIEPHAMAFARMMFAHAAFEREVRELQSEIANEHGFGERRANQWRTPDRAERMVALIEKHLGQGLSETAPIEKLLTDAVELCGSATCSRMVPGGASTETKGASKYEAEYGGTATSLHHPCPTAPWRKSTC
jgi:hypothetical protein